MSWLAILHLLLLTGLFVLGIVFIRCAVRAHWILKKSGSMRPSAIETWPAVTVQIPVRNEANVIERVLRASSQLYYPDGKLEIQVLDDSDDCTSARVDRLVAELRESGRHRIEVIRRARRDGFKAGAMAEGLKRAAGEFIAVFDADCIPEPDFLLKSIPYFHLDSRIGLVQGRWGFVNREQSWLTRVQAILLDSLMLVEQPVRFAQRKPFQFNGSGGVWRRRCIDNSGGWRSVSVAEDLDLSFRAVLGGWRFVHLSGLVVDTELPDIVSSYRIQQKRWTCGSAQVLRELWWPILRSSRPVSDVVAMYMHLCRRAIFPLIAGVTVLAPLMAFGWIPFSVPFGLPLNLAIWAFFLGGFLATLVQARRMLQKSVAEVLILYPLVVGLLVGLSLTCTVSFLYGLVVRNSRFVRTPKRGDGLNRCSYGNEFDATAVMEVLAGTGYLAFTHLAVGRGLIFESCFFGFFALSFLSVGLSALAEAFAIKRRPRLAPSPELEWNASLRGAAALGSVRQV